MSAKSIKNRGKVNGNILGDLSMLQSGIAPFKGSLPLRHRHAGVPDLVECLPRRWCEWLDA